MGGQSSSFVIEPQSFPQTEIYLLIKLFKSLSNPQTHTLSQEKILVKNTIRKNIGLLWKKI